MSNVKKRSIFFDNIKGLLIALVVLAHCLFSYTSNPYIRFLVIGIYYVHMPAFLFVSGYFSKSENARRKETVIKFLLAYLLVISIYITWDVIQGNAPHILSTYHSEWYLVALVIMRLLAPHLKKSKRTVFALFCFAIVSGYWQDLGGSTILSINKISCFFPFFFAGYLLDSETLCGIRNNRYKKMPLEIALLILTLFAIFLSYCDLRIGLAEVLPQEYPAATIAYAKKRFTIFMTAAAFIVTLLNLAPDCKIPVLTKAGRNSFSIYIIHRPLTLIFDRVFASRAAAVQVWAALAFTVLALVMLGSDFVSGKLDRFLNFCTDCISGKRRNHLCRRAIAAFIALLLLIPAGVQIYTCSRNKTSDADPIFRIMDKEEQARYEDAFRLLFCGDLILLEDQVKNAYTGSGYDFTENFEYTKEYISDADFSIGVFEGPLGGTARNYSSSNYDDGKELYVNCPDAWADAVKAAGFDLVTLANNHILDMGVEGKDRTIDVLREKQIDFVGAYQNIAEQEDNRVRIFETDGIRFAVLAYTAFINGFSQSELISGTLAGTTNLIVDPSNPEYETVIAEVQRDFEQAKALNADLILVLPHWGTQFADEPNDFQLFWQKKFEELGADIILGDHTHSVQPVGIDDNKGFTLFCPGNYANIYRAHNGDCSALVEVYISRTEKQVIGGAVIPMWTSSSLVGNYRAIPIYSILTDPKVGKTLTTYDLERVRAAQKHITKTMLGSEIDITLPQERYYFDANGFMRTKAEPIEIRDEKRAGKVYSLLRSAKRICFVGDSVTEGTKNGGAPWYEPLERIIPGEIINCGWGGATTRVLINNHLDEIVNAKADLYIIAIGTNDVRYRSEICAMTEDEYLSNLRTIRDAIRSGTPDSQFIFVAPWTSVDGDQVSQLPYKEKVKMNNDYSTALKNWTESTGDVYVNANPYIDQYLKLYPHSRYLIDSIHPNYQNGIALYSTAFLLGAEAQ